MGAPSKLCLGGKATNPAQPLSGRTIELKAMEAVMESFAGKVALVTGGSSGIGKATALAFAKGGANVVIAARGEQMGTQTVDEITAAGGKAIFVPTDVSKSADVERLVARTVEVFGRLDCAFNNAANPDGSIGMLTDLTEENFDKSVSINLKSVWLGMKYEIRQMLAQEPRGGVIVNTSSANGLGGCPQASFYAAAKAGVIALSKSAAWEYAQQGVRINALVPGAFRTPMLEGSIDRAAAGDPEARQTVEAKWNSMIASGRIGDPAEAAAAVLWLCSDASSYVVGHSMIVDGGITALWR
jgi:NAD(P)-dependent dehydrogenase (short-subunit alcohol dehydrogenase family)